MLPNIQSLQNLIRKNENKTKTRNKSEQKVKVVQKKKKKPVRIDIISTDQKDIFREEDSRDTLEKEEGFKE